MKKRVKYLVIFAILIISIYGLVDIFTKAKVKKDEELALEKNKVAKKEVYSIKRVNNKYKVNSSKLGEKKLTNLLYDNVNIYLYYEDEKDATLLKYNIESSKVVVLFENDPQIRGGIQKIGKYYKIGNSIYNKKFEKIMEYPSLAEGELLLPNLKNKLVKSDIGISLKSLETDEEKQVVNNSEEIVYTLNSINNDGSYILLNKQEKDKNYIAVMDSNYNEINTFENKPEDDAKSYKLLKDTPYLLEETIKDDEKTYKIYDIKTAELIYKSADQCNNYYFYNTKFVCNDNDGNIKLMDYVTKEEKVLLSKGKKDKIPEMFILASDNYSVVLKLENETNEFYVFYL